MLQSLQQHLLDALNGVAAAPRYWVAYSGGLDSTVLLHLVARVRGQLDGEVAALHVDHGISEQSAQWAEQCRHVCAKLGIPFRLERVSVTGSREKGLEAAARHARYAAFERVLGKGEVLLSAHHRDDQVETLLLQLLRGGGVHGLAAMPRQRPLGAGRLVRPLLELERERLRACAVAQGLDWIDDPGNFDTSLERNYVRHTLLPQLAGRRSGIRTVLARSAAHFAESARLLDQLAEMDMAQVRQQAGQLSVAALLALPAERCRNLLRFHLRRLGLPLPEHRHLQRILDELLPAAEDAMPLVAWPGAEVRRYRDTLYAMAPLPDLPDTPLALPWSGEEELVLPHALGRICSRRSSGEGLSAARLRGRKCEFRLRQGGERLRPAGRREHHTLKKLYQEAGVPPWERDRRPLLFVDDRLAQVPGYWSAAEFAADRGEAGIIFDWLPGTIEKGAQNDDNY